jgi:alkylation response protein AidB-like acyl-CoA dehydrogenase
MESVEDFRLRARAWIKDNLEYVGPVSLTLRAQSDEHELAEITENRRVQRKMFDAGFAGVAMPKEYGGQGLTAAHQKALNEELAGYEFANRLQVPTFTPLAAVILDFGTEEQKKKHIPAILKGEEIWMQFLSEPSGGSDMAGLLTKAERDGDDWVLNGSKIWTTGAWWSDWGLCLARTNWDVPKHRGLTVFMLPIKQPGVEVHRIEMLNGNKEFCQEFLTDVRVPDSDRVGDVDAGWSIAQKWMFHERMLYNSPYTTVPTTTYYGGGGSSGHVALAREAGKLEDRATRQLIGESRMLNAVGGALTRRVTAGVISGAMSDQAASISRVFSARTNIRRATISFTIAGSSGGAWTSEDGRLAELGIDFLTRQGGAIGGGTTEMALNGISERVLGMPRELTTDHQVPFRDVPRGPGQR